MSNWCSNQVTITFTKQEEYIKFLNQAGINEEGIHKSKKEQESLFDLFMPSNNSCNFRIHHWGCKSNPIIDSLELDNKGLIIWLYLSTPWSPPCQFFYTLTLLFPCSKVELIYDEPGMGLRGAVSYKGDEYKEEEEETDNLINN